ncbi:MAG TPA: T9SS type A sorting domain-containing protein [Ignavibacteria bacterium]
MGKFKRILQTNLFFIIFFLFVFSGFAQQSRMKDKFYLGTINDFWKKGYRTTQHQTWYNQLSYNMMQSYNFCLDNPYTGPDSISKDGGFFGDFSFDNVNTTDAISFWNNFSNDNSLIFTREKVIRPAYGQRSFYLVKYNSSQLKTGEINPGYGYLNRSQDPETDYEYGVEAIHLTSSSGTGPIVYGLYENNEQTNYLENSTNNSWGHRVMSDYKSEDYRWFVIPKMRIDPEYALNHLYDEVMQIRVKKYNGLLLKVIHIICKDFFYYDEFNIPHYDGRYLENYFVDDDINISVKAIELKEGAVTDEYGKTLSQPPSQVDYEVYWPGTVDVWIEGVIVEDEWAHYLFSTTYDDEDINPNPNNIYRFHHRLYDEVHSYSNNPGFGYYWVDEGCYNNIACIAEVNRLVKEYSQGHSAIVLNANTEALFFNDGLKEWKPENIEKRNAMRKNLRDTLINTGAISNLWIATSYPFLIWTYYPRNLTLYHPNPKPAATYCYTKNDAEGYNGNGESDNGIQHFIQLDLEMNKPDRAKAKISQIPFAYQVQVHSDEGTIHDDCTYVWGLREPTNEEIRLGSYLGLALGAQLLLDYSYYSGKFDRVGSYYTWGITNLPDSNWNINNVREYNYYGQPKYSFLVSLNQKLKAIGNYIYPSGQINKHLKYDMTLSVNKYNNNDINYKYLKNIESWKRNNSSIYTEQDTIKFWELGFFDNNPNNPELSGETFSHYFIAVNKRCYPESPIPDNLYDGDLRKLKIKFDANSTELAGFNNWKLTDPITGNTVATFDKTQDWVDAGIFQPGEGKLFKFAPVMQEGGTLVCNEEIGTVIESFECKGEVIGNNKNISIPNKVTINFHPAGKITMNGGDFTCGQSLQNRDIVFQGFSPFYWNGFEFNSCSNIDIRNCKFIKSPKVEPGTTDYVYSLKIKNCICTIISNCDFEYSNTEYSGAIKMDFIKNFIPKTSYIGNCTFNTGVSTAPIVNITSVTSNVIPLIIENNIFIASGEEIENNALAMSFIIGGAIKSNSFTNYKNSAIFLNTSLDFYKNTIICNRKDAIGIQCIENTFLNMSPVKVYNIAGHNSINNLQDGVLNISATNSMFYLDNGYNYFNITGIENGSYHMKGYFPKQYYEREIKATYNCFNKDGNMTDPVYDVTWGIDGIPEQVNFVFNPSSCIPQSEADVTVFELNNNIKDTVRINNMTIQSTPLKMLYDSININVRKNDYEKVISQGYTFLNNYADSLESIDIIGKLYLASLVLDSSGNKIQPLMSYYENLIQNYSQDTSLISRAYYFIQKCKVALTDYQSALIGFQEIMNQNPYTYEGLLASWDYSATTLLIGGGGSFKEQLPADNVQVEIDENSGNVIFETLITQMLDSLIKDRKTIRTNNTDMNLNINQNKTETKNLVITKNIENVFEGKRKNTENRIKDLEKKMKSDNEKMRKEAVKELIKIKNLGEVIKARNPKDIDEHIKFVNRDINKVFGGGPFTKESKKANIIPTEYALYQNFPNPFNPVTKISFDLPKDSKVKLIVYDILGREITRLLNSEFKPAGKYVVEFNAVNLNLASGVYFYRIETDKFTAVKKMVLIK